MKLIIHVKSNQMAINYKDGEGGGGLAIVRGFSYPLKPNL
jgi:hypothetical protein